MKESGSADGAAQRDASRDDHRQGEPIQPGDDPPGDTTMIWIGSHEAALSSKTGGFMATPERQEVRRYPGEYR